MVMKYGTLDRISILLVCFIVIGSIVLVSLPTIEIEKIKRLDIEHLIVNFEDYESIDVHNSIQKFEP